MAMMGRYELIRALKGGGMAEVFLGRRRGPGGVEKRLVVKRIRREYARDPRFIRLFLSEARLSMSLTHQNIVPVFDFGRAGDELFFVMEYVDGVDLARAIARGERKQLESIVAAYIAMEVCQALDYAHRVRKQRGPAGVVHRDVTPRNVLLSYAGEVKLADFGVATLTNAAASIGSVRGTPAYMAPEQARGEDVDGRADLFSLGLVLWEMLSGTRAYAGSDAKALLDCAKAADIPPLPDDVPAELRAVVERATRAQVDERFADATQMQHALDRFVVARRAADSDVAPPNQLLCSWLTELFPYPLISDKKVSLDGPDGSVVTFLDDGEKGIAQIIDEGGTQRSMAETKIDATEEPAAAPARKRTAMGYALLAVAIAAALAIWLVTYPGTLGPETARETPRTNSLGATIDDLAPTTREVTPAVSVADAAVAPPLAVIPDAGVTTIANHKTKPFSPRRRRFDAAVKRPPGRLQISTSPWARVHLVGTKHRCADTPCTLQLPAGTYTVKLSNPYARVGKTVKVTILPGKTHRLRETLTRSQ